MERSRKCLGSLPRSLGLTHVKDAAIGDVARSGLLPGGEGGPACVTRRAHGTSL